MEKELIFAATGLVRDMAQQKPMTADEIVIAVSTIAHGLESIAQGAPAPSEQPTLGQGIIDPKAAIKENAIICLECGRKFKILTRKHLATHGLTPEEYRAKHGYKKTQALACKSLVRERRKTMQKSKLWERRKKPETSVQQ